MKVLHYIGGALVILAVYDMVAPSVSSSLPTLPQFPTSNNLTNLLIGAGVFAVPMFL